MALTQQQRIWLRNILIATYVASVLTISSVSIWANTKALEIFEGLKERTDKYDYWQGKMAEKDVPTEWPIYMKLYSGMGISVLFGMLLLSVLFEKPREQIERRVRVNRDHSLVQEDRCKHRVDLGAGVLLALIIMGAVAFESFAIFEHMKHYTSGRCLDDRQVDCYVLPENLSFDLWEVFFGISMLPEIVFALLVAFLAKETTSGAVYSCASVFGCLPKTGERAPLLVDHDAMGLAAL